jgi:hypothetical protein
MTVGVSLVIDVMVGGTLAIMTICRHAEFISVSVFCLFKCEFLKQVQDDGWCFAAWCFAGY